VSDLAPTLLDELLEKTSRTFALTIPLLDDGPLREQVKIAYLLFRIADTLEDADLLGRDARVAHLALFEALLAEEHPASAKLQRFVSATGERPPSANADLARLLACAPDVFVGLEMEPDAAAAAIRAGLAETTRRMAGFVKRADPHGSLALADLADLRAYCYAVAGIVGEMLTELVLLDQPRLQPARAALRMDSVAFGEALQLTNILKDAGADAREGRTYVPPSVDRAEVFALATDDLRRAREYTAVLHAHGATRGTLAFHALPVRLAERTLARVRNAGVGAKITREELAAEIAAMRASLDAGRAGF
jgi:farnesyl-diphosphate farnesyltransferase